MQYKVEATNNKDQQQTNSAQRLFTYKAGKSPREKKISSAHTSFWLAFLYIFVHRLSHPHVFFRFANEHHTSSRSFLLWILWPFSAKRTTMRASHRTMTGRNRLWLFTSQSYNFLNTSEVLGFGTKCSIHEANELFCIRFISISWWFRHFFYLLFLIFEVTVQALNLHGIISLGMSTSFRIKLIKSGE